MQKDFVEQQVYQDKAKSEAQGKVSCSFPSFVSCINTSLKTRTTYPMEDL